MLGVQKSLIYLSQRLAAAGGANDANDYPHQLNVIWCLCRVRLRLQFLPPTLPSHFFGAQDSHKTSVAPDKHLRDLKSREISDVLKLLRDAKGKHTQPHPPRGHQRCHDAAEKWAELPSLSLLMSSHVLSEHILDILGLTSPDVANLITNLTSFTKFLRIERSNLAN
jgi:hypothetical protein